MIYWKYLDKKKAAAEALKDYDSMLFIIENTALDIRNVVDNACAISAQVLSELPSSSDVFSNETRIINSIDECDVLQMRYFKAIRFLKWFEPAWARLTSEEQYVLREFYCSCDMQQNAVNRICSHFNIERSSAYNKKNRALSKFATLLYG